MLYYEAISDISAVGAFIIPEALIIITLITGFFLQPETKGKALMDQMVEANYGRLENELPRALMSNNFDNGAFEEVDASHARHRKSSESSQSSNEHSYEWRM
uniref:MFS domain-containing protein n=1 Tax=Heterorhabditis bacteriophora TaxID=37862 RepID=A0A1I7X0C0_HETBA